MTVLNKMSCANPHDFFKLGHCLWGLETNLRCSVCSCVLYVLPVLTVLPGIGVGRGARWHTHCSCAGMRSPTKASETVSQLSLGHARCSCTLRSAASATDSRAAQALSRRCCLVRVHNDAAKRCDSPVERAPAKSSTPWVMAVSRSMGSRRAGSTSVQRVIPRLHAPGHRCF